MAGTSQGTGLLCHCATVPRIRGCYRLVFFSFLEGAIARLTWQVTVPPKGDSRWSHQFWCPIGREIPGRDGEACGCNESRYEGAHSR